MLAGWRSIWFGSDFFRQLDPTSFRAPALHQRVWSHCTLWEDKGRSGRQPQSLTESGCWNQELFQQKLLLHNLGTPLHRIECDHVWYRSRGGCWHRQEWMETASVWSRTCSEHELCAGLTANPQLINTRHEKQHCDE